MRRQGVTQKYNPRQVDHKAMAGVLSLFGKDDAAEREWRKAEELTEHQEGMKPGEVIRLLRDEGLHPVLMAEDPKYGCMGITRAYLRGNGILVRMTGYAGQEDPIWAPIAIHGDGTIGIWMNMSADVDIAPPGPFEEVWTGITIAIEDPIPELGAESVMFTLI
jgi:hypothetical protein